MSAFRGDWLSFEMISSCCVIMMITMVSLIMMIYAQFIPNCLQTWAHFLLHNFFRLPVVNEIDGHVLRISSFISDFNNVVLEFSVSADIIEEPLKNKFREESTKYKHDVSLSQEKLSILFQRHQISLSVVTLRHNQIYIFQASHSSQQSLTSYVHIFAYFWRNEPREQARYMTTAERQSRW